MSATDGQVSIPVTIVIATRNAADTLEQALASVRTYAAGAELIIVDGASTDNTLDIARANDDVVTRITSEPDDGIYDALNKGLKLASRNWFYVMGADDLLLPGFAQLVGNLDDPHAFYYGKIRLRQRQITSGGKYDDRRLMVDWPNHQALLAPTNAVRAVGGFDKSYQIAADWLLHLKTWQGGERWRYLDVVVCDFNETGSSSTGPDRRFRRQRWLLFLRYLSTRAVARLIASRVARSAASHLHLQWVFASR